MLQINKGNLYKVLKDFYTLTHIRIVLIDGDFNELMSYPPEREGFCAIVRKNLEVNANCVVGDKAACQKCAKTKELIRYRCHIGLTEAVIPIYDKNGVLGYAMFGQALSRENYEETKKKLKARFPEHIFSGVEEAIEKIPVKSDAELNAAATVLQMLVMYVTSNQWVVPGRTEFVRKMDSFIEKNMGQTITVDDICTEFSVGRTRLYDMAEDYLGCGIAEYIRNRRIEQARKLLEETDMPVGEIAYATGFSDYTHFFRIFKKVCGMSAREYRKENEKKNTGKDRAYS